MTVEWVVYQVYCPCFVSCTVLCEIARVTESQMECWLLDIWKRLLGLAVEFFKLGR